MQNNIKSVEYYREKIMSFVTYILKRNNDIDINNSADFDIEMMENEFYKHTCGKYEILIGNKRYSLNMFMKIKDAQYVMKNINRIDYVFSEFEDEDTLVGDISIFVKTKLGNDLQTTDYFYAIIMYENYVKNAKNTFTEKDVYDFIERKVCHD